MTAGGRAFCAAGRRPRPRRAAAARAHVCVQAARPGAAVSAPRVSRPVLAYVECDGSQSGRPVTGRRRRTTGGTLSFGEVVINCVGRDVPFWNVCRLLLFGVESRAQDHGCYVSFTRGLNELFHLVVQAQILFPIISINRNILFFVSLAMRGATGD